MLNVSPSPHLMDSGDSGSIGAEVNTVVLINIYSHYIVYGTLLRLYIIIWGDNSNYIVLANKYRAQAKKLLTIVFSMTVCWLRAWTTEESCEVLQVL